MQHYNLLNEKWIKVLGKDYEERLVSLRDVFRNAGDYLQLAGETQVQDMAVLRLLAAIAGAVLLRERPSREDIFRMCRDMWKTGGFPWEAFADYFDRYEERFRLFDGDRPFYQMAELENTERFSEFIGKNTEVVKYKAGKLNGLLSEGKHKARLFSMVSGAGKEALPYDAGARWLVSIIASDDAAVKPGHDVGLGHLGKTGPIAVYGADLFETILFASCLLRDGEEPWEGRPLPAWEKDDPEKTGKTKIASDNYPEILTMQSRRFHLVEEGGMVTGFYTKSGLGGECLDEKDMAAEQMTLWGATRVKGVPTGKYFPRKSRPGVLLWDNLCRALSPDHSDRLPGTIRWCALLCREVPELRERRLEVRTVGLEYDTQSASVTNTFSDSFRISASTLAGPPSGFWDAVAAAYEKLRRTCELFRRLGSDIEAARRIKGTHVPEGRTADKKPGPKKLRGGDDAADGFRRRCREPFTEWFHRCESSQDMSAMLREWDVILEGEALQEADGLMLRSCADPRMAALRKGRRGQPDAYGAYRSFMYMLKKLFSDEREDTNL